MIQETTTQEIQKLLEALRLGHTKETVGQAIAHAQKTKPSYSAFLLELLEEEHQYQRNRSIARRIKNSGLREYWALETFPWRLQKCVSKKLIEELAELDFIDRGESVVFIGPAGAGKSGLAGGILLRALYAGRSALAITAQDLFDEFSASLADRSTKRFLEKLSRADLLLIDEFGYTQAPQAAQVNGFFQLMNNRSARKSCLLTTNLGFNEWSKFLGSSALAAALLSRLLQKRHIVTFPPDAVNLREPALKLPARALFPENLKNFVL